jgi:hypothetical protein
MGATGALSTGVTRADAVDALSVGGTTAGSTRATSDALSTGVAIDAGASGMAPDGVGSSRATVSMLDIG